MGSRQICKEVSAVELGVSCNFPRACLVRHSAGYNCYNVIIRCFILWFTEHIAPVLAITNQILLGRQENSMSQGDGWVLVAEPKTSLISDYTFSFLRNIMFLHTQIFLIQLLNFHPLLCANSVFQNSLCCSKEQKNILLNKPHAFTFSTSLCCCTFTVYSARFPEHLFWKISQLYAFVLTLICFDAFQGNELWLL